MNEKPEIEVGKLPVITKFIYTLGVLPTSYLMSMTYQEQVTWLYNYLQTQVIPLLNTESAAIQELQTLYELLRTYVNDYFDNLDVQEEINNKLDVMASDGSLTTLIGNYVNPYIDEQNQRITNIDNKVNAIDNSPIVVSNGSDMTDTTRVYVLSTNGHWYWYDGDSWEDGGVYQATGISDDSITIFKLDDMMQDEFIKEYTNVSYTPNLQGYGKVVDGSIAIDDDNTFVHAIVDLTNGYTYEFAGYNYYVVCGLIVYDSSDNHVVYSTRDESSTSTGLTNVKSRFKVNSSGLKACISLGAPSNTNISGFQKQFSYLIHFNNIVQNYKRVSIESIDQRTPLFITKNTTVNNTPQTDTADEAYIDIYKMNKGVNYDINTSNLWQVSGIVITDNTFKTLYTSSTAYHGSIENIHYNFTAEQDGYIFLSYISTRFTPQIKIINGLAKAQSKYHDKLWCAMGDSLTAVSTLGDDDNYLDYVSDDLDISYLNYGHGGAGYKARYLNNQAFYQIAETLDENVDVITVFGSFNDTYSTLSSFDFGNITDDDVNTIFGSMNVTFDKLIENYPNAVIGVIIPTPWEERNSITSTATDKEKAETYVNGLKAICERRSIPYLDLYTKSNLYPWDNDFKSTFFLNGDGTHPNTLGHKKFSAQIEEFIKSILY